MNNLRRFLFYRIAFGFCGIFGIYTAYNRTIPILQPIPHDFLLLWGSVFSLAGFWFSFKPFTNKGAYKAYWPSEYRKRKRSFLRKGYWIYEDVKSDCRKSRQSLLTRIFVMTGYYPLQCCRIQCNWDDGTHCQHHFNPKKFLEKHP